MINILYLAFGKKTAIYTQTCFSAQTLWAQHPDVSIHIVSDHPEYFGHLSGGGNLTIHKVDEEQLQAWTWAGNMQYLYRIKLKVVEMLVEQYPDRPLIFLDSDTFVHRPMDQLFQALQSGKALMHEQEHLFSQASTKTGRHVWRDIKGRDLGGIRITAELGSWNSGVIGIPVLQNRETVAQALAVNDELCHCVERNNFVEQIAFSLVLSERYGLVEAIGCVGHYWGNKDEWNNAIQQFYLESYLQNHSFEQEVESLRNFDFSAIPFRKDVKNTRLRLEKRVAAWFPDSNPKRVG